jgi:hypothetical protein
MLVFSLRCSELVCYFVSGFLLFASLGNLIKDVGKMMIAGLTFEFAGIRRARMENVCFAGRTL